MSYQQQSSFNINRIDNFKGKWRKRAYAYGKEYSNLAEEYICEFKSHLPYFYYIKRKCSTTIPQGSRAKWYGRLVNVIPFKSKWRDTPMYKCIMGSDIVSTSREILEKFIRELHRSNEPM